MKTNNDKIRDRNRIVKSNTEKSERNMQVHGSSTKIDEIQLLIKQKSAHNKSYLPYLRKERVNTLHQKYQREKSNEQGNQIMSYFSYLNRDPNYQFMTSSQISKQTDNLKVSLYKLRDLVNQMINKRESRNFKVEIEQKIKPKTLIVRNYNKEQIYLNQSRNNQALLKNCQEQLRQAQKRRQFLSQVANINAILDNINELKDKIQIIHKEITEIKNENRVLSKNLISIQQVDNSLNSIQDLQIKSKKQKKKQSQLIAKVNQTQKQIGMLTRNIKQADRNIIDLQQQLVEIQNDGEVKQIQKIQRHKKQCIKLQQMKRNIEILESSSKQKLIVRTRQLNTLQVRQKDINRLLFQFEMKVIQKVKQFETLKMHNEALVKRQKKMRQFLINIDKKMQERFNHNTKQRMINTFDFTQMKVEIHQSPDSEEKQAKKMENKNNMQQFSEHESQIIDDNF